MKNQNKIQHFILVISFLQLTYLSIAQLPGFDDLQKESQPAAISSIVALGLIAGAAYGINK